MQFSFDTEGKTVFHQSECLMSQRNVLPVAVEFPIIFDHSGKDAAQFLQIVHNNFLCQFYIQQIIRLRALMEPRPYSTISDQILSQILSIR